MKSEIEAKFLNVDHDEIRAKLTALGAECVQPMRQMRRMTFENPAMKARNGWIRVRDEGDRTTLSYKQTDALTIDGTKETEVTVSSFDDMIAIMQQFDMNHGSFQESRRETWRLGDAEIVLDEWPWLHPYIEIEAETSELVQSTAEQLGFSMGDALYGDVMVAYRAQYPHLSETDTVGGLSEVKFDTPLPDMMKPPKT